MYQLIVCLDINCLLFNVIGCGIAQKIPKIGYCGQSLCRAIFVMNLNSYIEKPEHGTSYLLHLQFRFLWL